MLDQQDYIIHDTPAVEVEPLLPNLLSDLILVALVDLEKAEASSCHRVSMSHWHDICQTGLPSAKSCFVCLAGGVMAFSLNAPQGEHASPHDWGEPIRLKLYALNSVRVNLVREALEHMGHPDVSWRDEPVHISPYVMNASLFKSQMRDLAGRLAAAGY